MNLRSPIASIELRMQLKRQRFRLEVCQPHVWSVTPPGVQERRGPSIDQKADDVEVDWEGTYLVMMDSCKVGSKDIEVDWEGGYVVMTDS